jgi:protease I
MKKILLVVAGEGFQHQEYFDTAKVLVDAGFVVVTASDRAQIAIAKNGMQVAVDVLLEKVDPINFDGIFFIGGPGALEHLDNQESNRILNEVMILERPYGAICIAPRILARAHVLVGKRATGWDGDEELAKIFAQNNVAYIREPVVVDGNIVTANGPAAAHDFGEAIRALFQ